MDDRCHLCDGRGRVDFPTVTMLEGRTIFADHSFRDRVCPTCGGSGSLIQASLMALESRVRRPPPSPKPFGGPRAWWWPLLLAVGCAGWAGFLLGGLWVSGRLP